MDGSKQRPLGSSLNADSPSFSPDGTQLVFTGVVDGRRQIFKSDTNGCNLVCLSNNRTEEFAAHWGPEI